MARNVWNPINTPVNVQSAFNTYNVNQDAINSLNKLVNVGSIIDKQAKEQYSLDILNKLSTVTNPEEFNAVRAGVNLSDLNKTTQNNVLAQTQKNINELEQRDISNKMIEFLGSKDPNIQKEMLPQLNNISPLDGKTIDTLQNVINKNTETQDTKDYFKNNQSSFINNTSIPDATIQEYINNGKPELAQKALLVNKKLKQEQEKLNTLRLSASLNGSSIASSFSPQLQEALATVNATPIIPNSGLSLDGKTETPYPDNNVDPRTGVKPAYTPGLVSESSLNPEATNGSYNGLGQFGADRLYDIHKKAPNVIPADAFSIKNGNITIKEGFKQKFLKDTELQKQVNQISFNDLEDQIKADPVLSSYVGKEFNGKPLTIEAIAGVTHRHGVGDAKLFFGNKNGFESGNNNSNVKVLVNGKERNVVPKDGNGKTAFDTINDFSGNTQNNNNTESGITSEDTPLFNSIKNSMSKNNIIRDRIIATALPEQKESLLKEADKNIKKEINSNINDFLIKNAIDSKDAANIASKFVAPSEVQQYVKFYDKNKQTVDSATERRNVLNNPNVPESVKTSLAAAFTDANTTSDQNLPTSDILAKETIVKTKNNYTGSQEDAVLKLSKEINNKVGSNFTPKDIRSAALLAQTNIKDKYKIDIPMPEILASMAYESTADVGYVYDNLNADRIAENTYNWVYNPKVNQQITTFNNKQKEISEIKNKQKVLSDRIVSLVNRDRPYEKELNSLNVLQAQLTKKIADNKPKEEIVKEKPFKPYYDAKMNKIVTGFKEERQFVNESAGVSSPLDPFIAQARVLKNVKIPIYREIKQGDDKEFGFNNYSKEALDEKFSRISKQVYREDLSVDEIKKLPDGKWYLEKLRSKK